MNINAAAGTTAGNTADVLDVGDLSRILRKSPSSVLADRSRAPHRLPPACTAPGTRQPLWLLSDVLAWLSAHREQTVAPVAEPVPTSAPRRGRPTKMDQARRAAAAQEGGAQ